MKLVQQHDHLVKTEDIDGLVFKNQGISSYSVE